MLQQLVGCLNERSNEHRNECAPHDKYVKFLLKLSSICCQFLTTSATNFVLVRVSTRTQRVFPTSASAALPVPLLLLLCCSSPALLQRLLLGLFLGFALQQQFFAGTCSTHRSHTAQQQQLSTLSSPFWLSALLEAKPGACSFQTFDTETNFGKRVLPTEPTQSASRQQPAANCCCFPPPLSLPVSLPVFVALCI